MGGFRPLTDEETQELVTDLTETSPVFLVEGVSKKTAPMFSVGERVLRDGYYHWAGFFPPVQGEITKRWWSWRGGNRGPTRQGWRYPLRADDGQEYFAVEHELRRVEE